MLLFILTAGSGWIAVLLLGANAAVPYVMKGQQRAAQKPLPGLRLHYALGLVVPGVAFIHAWLPMSVAGARGWNTTGMWLATSALAGLLWHVCIGFGVRTAKGAVRIRRRRPHSGTMVLLAVLIAAHIVLNHA